MRFLFLALVLLHGASHAQTLVHEVTGAAPNELFGRALTYVGDLNGDGRDDFAVGVPDAGAGRLQVHSGADGTLLYLRNAPVSPYGLRFGQALSRVGDLDGDGLDDIAVGAPGFENPSLMGTVWVYSGASGSILYRWDGLSAREELGWSISRHDDIDGDGRDDIIVGAPGASASTGYLGYFYVFSGRTGALLSTQVSPLPRAQFGRVVGSPGDYDGDGQRDIIATAPSNRSSGFVGLAWIFSGRSPHPLLRTLSGRSAGDFFGGSVLALGDITGDGREDFAIGASQDASYPPSAAGYVNVYAGGSGALVYTLRGDAIGDSFGARLAAAGDRDGDGIGDFAVGAHQQYVRGTGYVRLFSARTGNAIATLRGTASALVLGAAIDGTGDVHDDGEEDLLLGMPGATTAAGSDAGRVHVYTWEPAGLLATPVSLSVSSGGSQILELQIGNARAGSPYLVLGTASGTTPGFALGSLAVPLNFDAYTEFALLVPNSALLSRSSGALDAVGRGQAQLSLPRGIPGLVGLQLHHAALYATGGELFCTNAAPLVLLP
jgi:hypothetical protein